MRKKQVTVIGNYDATPEQFELGILVGRMLAELDVVTITGGRTGLMEAVAKGAFEAGGMTVGILPSERIEDGNNYNTITIPSGIGYARNSMNVLAADVVVAIGGAAGTLSEMAFAWTYRRPIISFIGGGGWADALAGKQLDHRHEEPIHTAYDLNELRTLLVRLLNLNVQSA